MLLIIILSIIVVASNETSRNQTTHYNVSQDLLLQDETIEESNNTIVSINTSHRENSTYEDINQTQEENLTETNQTTVNETEELNVTDADSTEEPLNITIITEEITNATITVTEEINITEENITEEVINEITPNNISNETILYDDPINTAVVSNETEPEFAKIVGGETISSERIQKYFRVYDDFSDVEFKEIEKESEPITTKLGDFVKDNIKGIKLNKTKYVIHVDYCNAFSNYCTLKINGVNTGRLYNSDANKFVIDDKLDVKIKSITFDYCDGQRFCNYHYDAYDVVELEVVRR